jgi:hypothetical protein
MDKYHKSIVTPITELQTSKYKGVINYKDNQDVLVKCSRCSSVLKTKLGWHLQAKWFREGSEYLCRSCNRVNWIEAGHKAVTGKPHPNKGKTYEQLHGVEKANLLKKQVAHYGSDNAQFGRPAYCGSGNGWSGWYKGTYFRSLLELAFIVNYLEAQSISYTSAEARAYKIPYINHTGTARNYFPDFVVGNTLIEIKPKGALNWHDNTIKFNAARDWCTKTGMKFKVFDDTMIDKLTSNQLITMYNQGIITWLPRYEVKFKQKYIL